MKVLSFLCMTVSMLLSLNALAQPLAERRAIQINVEIDRNTPAITLIWNQQSTGGNINVFRKDTLEGSTWGSPINSSPLPLSTTSYTDNNVSLGMGYEYQVRTTQSAGFVYSGIEKEPIHYHSGCILVVDSTYLQVLQSEIARLAQDLEMEGWNVETIYAGRSETPVQVKNKIMAKRGEMANLVKAVFLLGHVPVPYSGFYSGLPGGTVPPDGHREGAGNHTGAWAADAYYGDVDGNWTDVAVTCTTGRTSRLHNVPGDGKFDQSKIPSDVDLQVGRVDLYDMPAFSKSDTALLRDYLDRNHKWRTGQLTTVERAVVDNNFSGLDLAATGYHNFSTFVPMDSILKDDYFTNMKARPYLWSYGCGAGSFTSCNGVGRTTDFAADSLQSIFTILAGSYFGDWDVRNNLLRAPLANSALVCFWGGIPQWYVHSMGLGLNVGQGARASTNNNGTTYPNWNFNGSRRGIHIALMGDPTLRSRPFDGPKNLAASSANNVIDLNWTPSNSPNIGYNIYRVGDFRTLSLLNTTPVNATTFSDTTNRKSGNFEYLVRAVRIDTTTSGSYINLSAGVSTTVDHTFTDFTGLAELSMFGDLSVHPNPGNGSLTLTLNSTGEIATEIEVLSVSGKVVFSKNIHIERGSNSIGLNLELNKGAYLIRVKDGGGANSTLRYLLTN